jgi:mono/diheme cytochrome c family protein
MTKYHLPFRVRSLVRLQLVMVLWSLAQGGVDLALGQIPIIPSVPAEQTQLPIFGGTTASAKSTALEHPTPLANFRLHLDYRLPTAASKAELRLHPQRTLKLTATEPTQWQTLDLQYEHLAGQLPFVSATVNGNAVIKEERLRDVQTTLPSQEKLKFGQDFTAMVRFTTKGDGALFARCRPEKWEPDAKMFGLRDGHLFYDIGWLGVVNGKNSNLQDGKSHVAVVRSESGKLTLWVDGKMDGSKANHIRPDAAGHSFQLARGAEGFDGDLKDGVVENFRYWERALGVEEAVQLSADKGDAVNTPIVNWNVPAVKSTFPQGVPGVPTQLSLTLSGGAEIRQAWVQPLAEADHARLIGRWSEESLAEGEKIYQILCVTCHGSLTQEGSMPTSRHFQREPFKNGKDPFRIYQTLTQGYSLMMPLPQYTPEQKYSLIHYMRETFVAPHNPAELFPVNEAYLASLPKPMRTLPKSKAMEDPSRQYEKMDFGPVLSWTYQVGENNIAYKGLAVRLDEGPGGVSRGRAWMVYDHDTMQVATATTGNFIDWKGVAFDGSHGTHATLTGKALFTNPVGPGWANPANGSWEDVRFRGRDDKPYGPLPRAWMNYRGMYLHGSQVVQSYTIGSAAIMESPEFIDYGQTPVFIRTINIGKSSHDLKLRIAPESDGLQIKLLGPGTLMAATEANFQVLSIPAASTPINFRLALSKGLDAASLDALVKGAKRPLDLETLTHGGPARCPEFVTTEGVNGTDDGPFATDILTHPDAAGNPWQSWLRLTGFDFTADGKQAAVCTWMGDVWMVDGVGVEPLGKLQWHRIATGLFQPLGLKIVNGTIVVTCRDQIAKLHDSNKDGEVDFIECFNNDQQVTEHFHEFAMGLQTDAEGNFYYAKSARHALPAVVQQHGTLLKVSADGSRTDILATGFRAANGVCLNPDGTFFVTDQEGHWTPKNRINLVSGKGPQEFYGNMFGYHDITDNKDSAMRPPVCWVTNAFDRSPSELVWVPQNAKWGALNGTLLNLSYGYGKIYTVPYEKNGDTAQGGMCELPMPQFPTGVMRGRFHPQNGQFYACGMFAWASNQSQPGGFYRVRATGKPALQPLGLHFAKGTVQIKFSDPLDASATDKSRYSIKAWALKRTASYGSKHDKEHALEVTEAKLTDARTLQLTVPKLATTEGLEILCKLKQANGTDTERVIHGSINVLE